jgi:hypothetical protein
VVFFILALSYISCSSRLYTFIICGIIIYQKVKKS